MIDIENEVFTAVATALRADFPRITVSSTYVHAPKSFPHVSVVEQDNFPTPERMTNGPEETFATVMYEVNVYSDKATGKKGHCRKMMMVIDRVLYGLNFKRLNMNPVPNMEDANIYSLTARYRAETDGTTLYRR